MSAGLKLDAQFVDDFENLKRDLDTLKNRAQRGSPETDTLIRELRDEISDLTARLRASDEAIHQAVEVERTGQVQAREKIETENRLLRAQVENLRAEIDLLRQRPPAAVSGADDLSRQLKVKNLDIKRLEGQLEKANWMIADLRARAYS